MYIKTGRRGLKLCVNIVEQNRGPRGSLHEFLGACMGQFSKPCKKIAWFCAKDLKFRFGKALRARNEAGSSVAKVVRTP